MTIPDHLLCWNCKENLLLPGRIWAAFCSDECHEQYDESADGRTA